MKKYRITATETILYAIEINAINQDEAWNKTYSMNREDFEEVGGGFDIESVLEIE